MHQKWSHTLLFGLWMPQHTKYCLFLSDSKLILLLDFFCLLCFIKFKTKAHLMTSLCYSCIIYRSLYLPGSKKPYIVLSSLSCSRVSSWSNVFSSYSTHTKQRSSWHKSKMPSASIGQPGLPHVRTPQTLMHCVFWHLSIRTEFICHFSCCSC